MAEKKQRKKRRRRVAPSIAVNEDDRDLLDQYLYEVSKTPLLTPAEEIALAKEVRAGDTEAMQELAKRNLRFVISVAKKYQNRGLPLTEARATWGSSLRPGSSTRTRG
jgi:RNA polymerase primary sigma factor